LQFSCGPSLGFPPLVERSLFRPDVAKVIGNRCGVTLILGRVHGEGQTHDNDYVRIVIHSDFIAVTFADFYAILDERSDLAITLKDGALQTFVLIEKVVLVLALAYKYSLPEFLTPEAEDCAVRQLEIISGAQEWKAAPDSGQDLLMWATQGNFVPQ
jgi:hypothetical protein